MGIQFDCQETRDVGSGRLIVQSWSGELRFEVEAENHKILQQGRRRKSRILVVDINVLFVVRNCVYTDTTRGNFKKIFRDSLIQKFVSDAKESIYLVYLADKMQLVNFSCTKHGFTGLIIIDTTNKINNKQYNRTKLLLMQILNFRHNLHIPWIYSPSNFSWSILLQQLKLSSAHMHLVLI